MIDLVSIIIPCFNAVEYTKKCIAGILRNTDYNYELILINNGSSDNTKKYFTALKKKQIVSDKLKNIKILQFKKNLGVARALNTGIEKSQGRYICYVNNDVLVTKNWLSRMVKVCKADSKNAVIGTLFNAFEDKWFVKNVESDIKEAARIAEIIAVQNKGKTKPAKTIHGLCMLIKKSIFSKVGLFNENFYPCFGEDIEFCKRVKKKGYNLVDALDVFIFHYWSKSVTSNQFNCEYKSIEIVKKEHRQKFSIPKKYKI